MISLVLCTVPAGVADSLTCKILEARLAACVNRLDNVTSHYWWEGKIERADEVLLLIKTDPARIDDLRARVVEWHPYDVPEFVEFRADSGLAGYLDWVRANATGRPDA